MAVVSIVTLGLYVSQHTTGDPRAADRSLIGEHSKSVDSVAFDPQVRWLASAGSDGSVYLWDVDRRELGIALEQPTGPEAISACRLAFTPDGSSLAVSNSDGSVTLWDVASGTCRRPFPSSAERIRCVPISPDGRSLATGGFDNSIALWDFATMHRQ
jgi:WD40 repeat protein